MFKKEDFKSTQFIRRINRVIQITLCVSLILGLNYLAAHYYSRKDITLNRIYSLSPESLAYLEKIDKPVEIIITIPPESEQPESAQIYRLIARLAKEYEYATRNNKDSQLTVTFINPFKQSAKAQEIASEYNVQKENAIIIVSGEHHRQIGANDLFTFNNGDLESFKGEQLFTSAILDVTQDKRDKVYFIMGHGEMRTNDADPIEGLSHITDLLQSHNIEVATIDLSEEEIPEDASLLMLTGPKTPLLKREVAAIRQYLSDKSGRFAAFLNPGDTHGLDSLLDEWGIRTDDMVILDRDSDFQSASGDLILKHYVDHEITDFLIEYQLPVVMGFSRPVSPDLGAPLDRGLITVPLILSSQSSWGEHSYEDLQNASIDPARDLRGPLPVATISEKSINSQLGIEMAGGRMAIVGNADFIGNSKIHALGNKILFLNIVNWNLNRNDLLNIPPRALKKHQLTLSKDQLTRVGASLLAFPGTIACLGLLIYVIRKR